MEKEINLSEKESILLNNIINRINKLTFAYNNIVDSITKERIHIELNKKMVFLQKSLIEICEVK